MLDLDNRDYYNPTLGHLKLGVLLARKYPEKIDAIINCASLREVADLCHIPGSENIFDTADKMLKEWLGSQ